MNSPTHACSFPSTPRPSPEPCTQSSSLRHLTPRSHTAPAAPRPNPPLLPGGPLRSQSQHPPASARGIAGLPARRITAQHSTGTSTGTTYAWIGEVRPVGRAGGRRLPEHGGGGVRCRPARSLPVTPAAAVRACDQCRRAIQADAPALRIVPRMWRLRLARTRRLVHGCRLRGSTIPVPWRTWCRMDLRCACTSEQLQCTRRSWCHGGWGYDVKEDALP